MNGKRAKALRKLAQATTVGMPERKYMLAQRTGCIRLTQCTRLQYKAFKRTFPRGFPMSTKSAYRLASAMMQRNLPPEHPNIVRIKE